MKRQQADLHRNLKNFRDYNLQNGYAHSGIDAGREARGLIVTAFRLMRSIFSLIGAVISRRSR